jgi:transcriptional regulator with XRE-family HTH domain
MTFAKKLRSLRESLGLSRAALAERANIPRRTLAQYEQGQREPRWTTFVILASALQSPLEEFRECVVPTPKKLDVSEDAWGVKKRPNGTG